MCAAKNDIKYVYLVYCFSFPSVICSLNSNLLRLVSYFIMSSSLLLFSVKDLSKSYDYLKARIDS